MLDGGHVNFSWDSEGSSAFTRVANTTPGMNSMAVFHDVWMAKWNVNSAFVLVVFRNLCHFSIIKKTGVTHDSIFRLQQSIS